MDTGTRFIHTADWQIGMRAGKIPGDDGAVIRDARFEVVRRIADVAREHDAQFVVVAGDVFEHHALKRETLVRSFEALREFRCPVFLLPGNHDPFTPDAVYRSDWWKRECPPHVSVLGARAPVDAGNATLLPCPLLERHMHDPTAWLSDRVGPTDRVRVGVAHGAVRELLAQHLDADDEVENEIPLALAQRARLDYLALGDWHGRIEVNERTWYSGTPEATRFKEKHPGDVLAVELDHPRALPKVTPRSVAKFRWIRIERVLLHADDVKALENELEAIPGRTETLVEMTLSGTLDLPLYERVHSELLARHRDRFRHLRLDDTKLQVRLSDGDFDSLPREGWPAAVVQRLRAGVDGAPAALCQQALREMHRILYAVRSEGDAR